MTSFYHVPYPGRVELWKWFHAVSSFQMANEIGEQLVVSSKSAQENLTSIVSFYIFYARPFRQDPKKGTNLATTDVPANLQELHEQMMVLRDKVIAHSDRHSFGKWEHLAPETIVDIRTFRDGRIEMYPGLKVLFPRDTLKDMTELAKTMENHASHQISAFWKPYEEEFKQFHSRELKSRYVINMENQNGTAALSKGDD